MSEQQGQDRQHSVSICSYSQVSQDGAGRGEREKSGARKRVLYQLPAKRPGPPQSLSHFIPSSVTFLLLYQTAASPGSVGHSFNGHLLRESRVLCPCQMLAEDTYGDIDPVPDFRGLTTGGRGGVRKVRDRHDSV